MEALYIRTLFILADQPTTQPKSEQGRIHGQLVVAGGWAVMRAGRGSMGQGRGCNVTGQGQKFSEIAISVNSPSSKISRYQPTYIPRDTPSYRVYRADCDKRKRHNYVSRKGKSNLKTVLESPLKTIFCCLVQSL